jgi:hypothetical protein
MVGRDAPSPIKLLEEQNPDHGMGQSQVRQANALMRRLLQASIQPIGAADQQSHITAVKLPSLQFASQGDRGQ